MITELLKEKYLNKEIEIFLNGHVFYYPGNSSYYDGLREYTEWELEPTVEKTITNEDGSWSKFRTVKSKAVKVLEVVRIPDYEGTTWHLRCVGKKGKEYIIEIPE